jgi:ABC-type multidrug transport system ATPase subunit
MSESMLNSFIRFIAGICVVRADLSTLIVRKYLENYIEKNYGKRMVTQSVASFNDFLNGLKASENKDLIIQLICKAITKEFSITQRFQLIINLFNFFSFSITFTPQNISENQPFGAEDDLFKIAEWLKLDKTDFTNLRLFSSGQLHNIQNRENSLIISEVDPKISGTSFIQNKGINGFIAILYLKSSDLLLLTYKGQSLLEINGKPIYNNQTYILTNGSVITGIEVTPIYYGNIIKALTLKADFQHLTLTAQNIRYNYTNSNQGINNLSLYATSGELLGIMGGSGVGKSTLIKILSGCLPPQSGEVKINGWNIYKLSKLDLQFIGVMHQEECLVEELSVFENLYFSAKASIGGISDEELVNLCKKKLYELDLIDCQDNIVGPPENRQLSGGQRKRLAIAMEIIRDPKILLVDEPTTGLSSADSEMVMNILKNIALEGKLVIVNIHQPSSEIFKLFDGVILIDKGGIPIFMGHPVEAILHFKKETNRVDKDTSACECCGSIKPEQIFEMVEERTIDEYGQKRLNRKFSPDYWHQKYLKSLKKEDFPDGVYQISSSISSIPKLGAQFKTFFSRNLLTKVRNAEFIFFALILPPLLSILITLFLRFSFEIEIGATGYSLYSNPNIPSFFFISILSALFFGLIVSCEEIIRDKRIITRENNLGLSLKSFYNAKVLLLMIISAIQTILFALPGVIILQVKDSLLTLWLILFLVSILGNLLGLILSSSLKSVVAIYILVPFLIIPQILFSGLVVPFDNLNSKFTSQKYVPLIAEVIPTRWASEALMVRFYKENRYIKPFFENSFRESELRFRLLFLLPELNELADKLSAKPGNITNEDKMQLKRGLELLYLGVNQAEYLSNFEPWTDSSVHKIIELLENSKKTIANEYTRIKHNHDRAIVSIYPNTIEGREKMIDIKNQYHNLAIEGLVRNSNAPLPLVIKRKTYIQKSDPIYQIPTSQLGRSHFFAPYKMLGTLLIDTFWFNTAIIIVMVLILYILFTSNMIPRTIRLLV